MKIHTLVKIVIAIAMIMPVSAFAEDACRGGIALGDKLLNYDIEMRTKKIELRQKRIALMQQDNDLEKEMVQIEGKILKADGKATKDILQKMYDKVDERRENLDKEQDKLGEEYSKIVFERIMGRIKLRIASLESRYKCFLEKAGESKELDAKRNEFKQSIDAKLAELNALQVRKISDEKALVGQQDSLRASIRRTIRDWRDWLRDFAKELKK